MAYTVEWLVDKRVVYYKGEGNISVADVEIGVAELTRYLDEGEAPVHTISDNRYVNKFPTDLSLLRKFMTPHPNATGWSLLVQENALTRFVSEVVTRFAGQKQMKSFNTLAEALAFLERTEPNLGTVRNPEEA